MTKIQSDTIYLDKNTSIEPYINQNYGDVVRWAIVEVTDNEYKISFSYEVKEAQTD